MRAILLGLIATATAWSAPYIAYRGIVSAASYAPSGLPNGKLARGSIISIFGTGLGPATGVSANTYPLGTTLAGVTMSLTQGNTTVAGIPVYVAAAQINALLPSNTPLGRVVVRVTYNGQTSNAGYIDVAATSFGAYSIYAGAGPGIFQNFNAADNQPVNTLIEAAKPGQFVTLWGTGLGAVPNDTVAPTAGDLPGNIEIFVGGKSATKFYAGRSPCCAGSDQVVFQVPADAPIGCYVPVTVRVNGVPSNTTTMAIMPNGGTCTDAHNPFGNLSETSSQPRDEGFLLGAVAQDTDPQGRVNLGIAAKFERQSGLFRFHPIESLPPLGTCTVYMGKANLSVQAFLPTLAPSPNILHAAASLLLSGIGFGQPEEAKPFYFIQARAPREGDTYEVRPEASPLTSAAGGTVGAVSGTLNKTNFPAGTNLPALASIDRSTALDVRWTPPSGSPPFTLIIGGAGDYASNSAAIFVCLARPSLGTFTVPAYILQSLPAAKTGLKGRGSIAVGHMAAPGPLSAAGLIKGITLFTALENKELEYR